MKLDNSRMTFQQNSTPATKNDIVFHLLFYQMTAGNKADEQKLPSRNTKIPFLTIKRMKNLN